MPLIFGTIPMCEVDDQRLARAVEAARLMDNQGPESECMAQDCPNKGNLRKCSRCKAVRYCSVECQKRNWPLHKGHCAVMKQALDSLPEEQQWDRNLRHWNDRFKISIQKAFYYGLDLHNDHSNLDKYGMIIILQPRIHDDPGARFILKEVQVLPVGRIFWELGTLSPNVDDTIEMWRSQRERIRTERNGQCDFGLLILKVDPEAFERFTDEPVPVPRVKLTAVYWYMVEHAPQGREVVDHWACDFNMSLLVNLPQRLEDDDDAHA